MADTDHEIRELVERWARAVHAGDLGTVLADHADDIVMFDVPPPHAGVRGLEEYAATWPGFFAWQAAGACFEIVELEVTAGQDVAFAHALLRCGDPDELAAHPQRRLRLTLGLRREGGRWVVAHEHHSFADESPVPDDDERAVHEVHRRWAEDTAAGDLDALVAPIADDVVSYEHAGAEQYVGLDEVREVCRAGLEASPDPVHWEIPDLRVVVGGDLAVSWGIDELTPGAGGTVRSRGTRVFRRTADGWAMIHQHLSFPAGSGAGQGRGAPG